MKAIDIEFVKLVWIRKMENSVLLAFKNYN
jgi:hypothetical protein